MSTGKVKVAILGGGCGGMSAAFWLTSTAALRQRFDVTVYTRGWRLGGKGASGRNARCAERIEEHGLHMWMGCYENAFRTIRACFDEWRPREQSPIRQWTDAFAPQLAVTFMQLDGGRDGDEWCPWHFELPRRSGTPGDGTPLGWADRTLRLAGWLARCRARDGVPRAGALVVLAAIRLATLLLVAVRALLAQLTRAMRALARIRPIARYLILADLGLTLLIGIARDILPEGLAGFDRINGSDFREWLARHGAARTTLASAPVRALYDLGFAYPGGDTSDFANGRGAAGVALRFLLELGLGYKGAPLWKMNAGMGDIVFTPLYQVLVARGVQFRFFRDVARVELAADRRSVGTVVLRRQAELKTGTYAPLVVSGGLDCWPSEALWDQLVDGDRLARAGANFESVWDARCAGEDTLHAGTDFDHVVLAFPPEMIRVVAPELSAHSTEWRAMIDHSASVATQAFQLWLEPALPDLGWTRGPTVLSAFAAPFDTWADMSHLLPHEHWTGDRIPRTIAYFCGAMRTPDPLPSDPIRTGMQEVERDATLWLADNASHIWPRKRPGGAGSEPGPIVSAYHRCNVDPSERYVQTLPGSVAYRLAPGARTFGNLYLAGDWTITRYSSGCVEAAVESGMLAAQAIAGELMPIYGQ